jgi:hypothetical protein
VDKVLHEVEVCLFHVLWNVAAHKWQPFNGGQSAEVHLGKVPGGAQRLGVPIAEEVNPHSINVDVVLSACREVSQGYHHRQQSGEDALHSVKLVGEYREPIVADQRKLLPRLDGDLYLGELPSLRVGRLFIEEINVLKAVASAHCEVGYSRIQGADENWYEVAARVRVSTYALAIAHGRVRV